MHNRLIFEWLQEMFRTVSQEEWDLSELSQRLLNPPSAECLLARLIDEATQAAEANKICWDLEPFSGDSERDCSRLHAQIPVSECTFDLLFNGRSDYRAQYYLSPDEGEAYNRRIIEGLTPAVSLARSRRPETASVADLIDSSLKSHAKLAWYKDCTDALIFFRRKSILNVHRWQEYWNSKSGSVPMGLKDFWLEHPRFF